MRSIARHGGHGVAAGGPVESTTPSLAKGRSDWGSPLRTPWPAALLLLGLLLPPETSFMVGELRITLYRVLLLVLFIPCVGMLFSKRVGGVILPDVLMAFWVCWAALTFSVHHGLEQGLQSGGIYIVEGLGAYLVARCFIRDERSFRAFAALFTWIVVALLAFTLPEMLSGRNLIRPFFGGADPSIGGRYGLNRAFGPLQHPILLGVFCSAAVGLSFFALSRDERLRPRRFLRSVLVGASAMTSVSAGAWVAILVQAGLTGWHYGTRTLPRRWWWLLALMLCGYVFVALVSNRTPMQVLISRLAFNAHTGYNRYIIWQHGTQDVIANPLFGIGFNDWSRPHWMHSTSMDNFWLVVAVRHGLPALLALLGAIGVLIWQLSRIKHPSPMLAQLRMGWVVVVVGLSVAAFSVHLWDQVFVLFAFLIGSGAWMVASKHSR